MCSLFVLCLSLSGLLLSCVPLSDYAIDSAPCPCPAEYRCCREKCVKASSPCDETETETDTLDISTDTGAPSTDTEDTSSEPGHCVSNDECNGGEICLSWLDTEGYVQGPGTCRPTCFSSNECEAGEVCELALSGGRPISERRMALACLDTSGFEGCGSPSSCRQCVEALSEQGTDLSGDMSFQATICNDTADALLGCFVAFDGTCGLYCTTDILVACDCMMGSCGMVDANLSDVWCADYSCSQCEAEIGGASCVQSEKRACMSLSLTRSICNGDCACNEICVKQVVGECK